MRLAINLATRNRPHLLTWTIEQTLRNITLQDTVFMVSADDDDVATIDALQPYMRRDMGVEVNIALREDSPGAKFNRILKLVPDADCFLLMVDYAPHVVEGFDKRILEAAKIFPDGIGVVYNHMANDSFPQINAVTSRLAELMGGIYPESFPYWFVDHWLDDIARMTGRLAFADVLLDVSRQGERKTMEMREPYFWATFFDLCLMERRRMADRVIDALDDPPWRKTMMRGLYPVHERRSIAINRIVRDGSFGLVKSMGVLDADERYSRLKDAAVAMSRRLVPELRELRKTEPVPILTEIEMREQRRKAA